MGVDLGVEVGFSTGAVVGGGGRGTTLAVENVQGGKRTVVPLICVCVIW